MGLMDILKRLMPSSDAPANDDYEARKDDAFISSTFAGGEAMDVADDELSDDEDD